MRYVQYDIFQKLNSQDMLRFNNKVIDYGLVKHCDVGESLLVEG